jgi:hypothetical protein
VLSAFIRGHTTFEFGKRLKNFKFFPFSSLPKLLSKPQTFAWYLSASLKQNIKHMLPAQVCCFLGMPESHMEQHTLELKKTSPTITCYSIIPRLYCIYPTQEKFMLAAVMPSDSQPRNYSSAPLSHHPQSCSAHCNSISISSVLTIHSHTCKLTRTEPQQFIHIVL